MTTVTGKTTDPSSQDSATKRKGRVNRRVIPGFGLSMGITLSYLSLLVLIPLTAVFIRTSGLTWEEFWSVISSKQVVASYKVTFGISLAAAVANFVFGLIVA